MTTFELMVILIVGTCFLVALVYIVSQEKEEADIFKNWKQ